MRKGPDRENKSKIIKNIIFAFSEKNDTRINCLEPTPKKD